MKEKPILGRFRTNLKVRTRPAVGSWCRPALGWAAHAGPTTGRSWNPFSLQLLQPASARLPCMSFPQPAHLPADHNSSSGRPPQRRGRFGCAAAAAARRLTCCMEVTTAPLRWSYECRWALWACPTWASPRCSTRSPSCRSPRRSEAGSVGFLVLCIAAAAAAAAASAGRRRRRRRRRRRSRRFRCTTIPRCCLFNSPS